MAKDDKKDKKKFLDQANIRKYLIYAIIALAAYLYNKKTFLMLIFIVVTTVGKVVRGMFGNNMIMFDPLVFFSILIMKYWGFTSLFLFLFVTVFIADAMSGGFSAGSFLNYFLFHACPLISYTLLGKTDLAIYGNVAALLYSVIYVPIRINYMGGDPIATTIKGITNVVFVFLYISFFGSLFGLIM